MPYHYTDESKASDEPALPDVEVFKSFYDAKTQLPLGPGSIGVFHKLMEDGEPMGWYYAHGTPGCLWDSDPVGPFDSEADALKAAREAAGFCEHGVADEDICEECPAPEYFALRVAGIGLYLNGRDHRTSVAEPWHAAVWTTRSGASQARTKLTRPLQYEIVKLSDARRWGRSDT